MGMMHAEMIVESCIVKFLKPFDAAYFQWSSWWNAAAVALEGSGDAAEVFHSVQSSLGMR